MKRFIFLMVCVMSLQFINNVLSAQEKRFRFETGINYPLGIQKDGFKESHIGIYFKGIYYLANSNYAIDLNLGYESYTIFPYSNDYPQNGRSVVLIPSGIYQFKKEGTLRPYLGLGAGISVDNTSTGVFNSGYKYHFAAVPKVGVLIANHINVSAMFYITHKDLNRLMVSCGYTF